MRIKARKGVASVLGTVFFVFVFMLAIGTMAYASGLQAQASQEEQAAVQNASMHAQEYLSFVVQPPGPLAINGGPNTVIINHIILRFPNSTIYALAASAVIPTGGELSVAGLVPSGVCSPGSATCASKFHQIVSGTPSGSTVGLVTSLGNTFWYPNAAGAGASPGGSALVAVLRSPSTTSGTGKYSSSGLSVNLASNATYVFYAFTSMSPSYGTEQYDFEIHALPPGAILLNACSTLGYPSDVGTYVKCVASTGKPVANGFSFGTTPPAYASPGIFGSIVTGGTSGLFEIDFACVAHCGSVTMNPGSFVVVQPAG